MATLRDARRIGGGKAFFACLWMLLFFEMLMFFIGSHGDFMHEGRNFMLSQEDPVATSAVVVVFVTVFLLGRVAGRQILINGKNHMIVALIQWAITMGVLIVYVLGFSWIWGIVSDEWGRIFLIQGLIIGCVWLLAVRNIKRASARLRGSCP
ncbi:MAG TPA: hypothetical protein VMH27_20250 [Puia sp.]|nr:hypothetical protein [Puia sp.]